MTANTQVKDITSQLSTHPEFSDHRKVFLVTDKDSGLSAKISVHSLINGTALGGCRRWVYKSDHDWSADGLRLSRGMTRKSAVAGLPLGGAKASINCAEPTAEMMRAFGKGIAMIEQEYGIKYITAEDVGITEALLKEVKKETGNVRGITPENAENVAGGDPGPFTAYGVFAGMQAAVKHKMGKEDMEGVKVAVQGLGDVGYYLCEFLSKAGARLFVADLDETRMAEVVQKFDAMPINPDEIKALPVDIFAPCAMGGVLDGDVAAQIVAGSANNQQQDEINNRESRLLMEKGILYAPDYVINAGGLISVFYEGEPQDKIMDMIYTQVFTTLEKIFKLSDEKEVDTATIADDLSEKMLRDKAAEAQVAGKRAAA